MDIIISYVEIVQPNVVENNASSQKLPIKNEIVANNIV